MIAFHKGRKTRSRFRFPGADTVFNRYEVWERSRIDGKVSASVSCGFDLFDSGSQTWDRFCFGHPNHQMFNSPFDFYPHFKFLMQYDGEEGICECRFCKSSKSVRKATSSRVRVRILLSVTIPIPTVICQAFRAKTESTGYPWSPGVATRPNRRGR